MRASACLFFGLVCGIAVGVATLLLTASAFGAEGGGGGGPIVCTGCTPPAPACEETTSCVDNCGVTYTSTGGSCTPPPEPEPQPPCDPDPCPPSYDPDLACGSAQWEYNGCTWSCYVSGPPKGDCSVTLADCTAATCGQRLEGTDSNCGSYCYADCWACARAPYGFILPGDPQYGFTYPKPETKDLIGLAAKGNIIIGDYTSGDFERRVLPNLRPKTTGNPRGKTQPYIIDRTDAPLGYHDAGLGLGLDGQNRPRFSGNYDQQDSSDGNPGTGTKLNPDGTAAEALDENGDPIPIPRKFYESSLPDEEFKKILDTNRNGLIDQGDGAFYNTSAIAKVDAVLFTNHALAGKVYADRLDLNGSLVSRDDGLIFSNQLVINHDQRLVNSQINRVVALPFTITRPRLVGVQECPPSGCAALP